MSSGFSLILIASIACFATGSFGRLAIPMMAIGAVGLVISAFTPASKRK